MKNSKVYAHRGYSEKYPENTIMAVQKAFESGAHGVECDLQKSRDGFYVIIHDGTVDRTAKNRKGEVDEMTLAELKTCDMGEGQTIPELDELSSTIPADCFLNLELKKETIKPADCPLIYDILMKYIGKDNIMISSVDPDLLAYFKEQKVTIGYLLENESRRLGFFGVMRLVFVLKPDYLNLPVQIFGELGTFFAWMFIWLIRLLCKKIAFWTINTGEDLKRIKNVSEMIITDRVEFILSELEKKK
jgi:glycerophosphoryl diester phosphodiesterase